jgi:TPR repeat protein
VQKLASIVLCMAGERYLDPAMPTVALLARSHQASLLIACAALILGGCSGPLFAAAQAGSQQGVLARQNCAEQALRNNARAELLSDAGASLSEGCQQGDAVQCSVLGVMLELGRGLPMDPPRAADAFAAACQLGNARGCTNLGGLYESGAGLRASLPRASAFFFKGCQQGDHEGCYRLGRMHELGLGHRQDATRAAGLFETSCIAGHAQSCLELATMNDRGAVIPRNPARAAMLYKRACHAGKIAGCSELDRLHSESGGRSGADLAITAPAAPLLNKADGPASLLGARVASGAGIALP